MDNNHFSELSLQGMSNNLMGSGGGGGGRGRKGEEGAGRAIYQHSIHGGNVLHTWQWDPDWRSWPCRTHGAEEDGWSYGMLDFGKCCFWQLWVVVTVIMVFFLIYSSLKWFPAAAGNSGIFQWGQGGRESFPTDSSELELPCSVLKQKRSA